MYDSVIKGLTCCTSNGYNCNNCPFSESLHLDEYGESEVISENGERYDDYDCSFHLMKAALEVLTSGINNRDT